MSVDYAAVLRAAGVPVREVEGWRTRGTRDAAGTLRSFQPVGILVHHDALPDGTSDSRAADVMVKGRPDLSGPLCNAMLAEDGTWWLIAAGNANHAGRGAQEVLDRLRQGQAPRGDAAALGLSDGPVGNGWLFGVECRNAGDGVDRWEDAQVRSLVLGCAAIQRAHHLSGDRVAAHREWTRRKIDPRGLDMADLRRLINAGGAVLPPEEDDMYTDDDRRVLTETRNAVSALLGLKLNEQLAGVEQRIMAKLDTLGSGGGPVDPATVKEAVKAALREGSAG